jgi:hypothetical protein
VREAEDAGAPDRIVLSLAWGVAGDGEPHTAFASSADGLARLLGNIHTNAVNEGLPQLVEVRGYDWPIEAPQLSGPRIRALVGHPERGSILWHEADQGWTATEALLAPLPEPFRYADRSETQQMETAWSRITPTDVLRVLTAYLSTGQRFDEVDWVPVSDA